MKFPVVSSSRHKGKTLEVDPAKETITLVGINGEPMGSLTWDFLVDQTLTYRKPQQPREARSEPRISLSIRVKYTTPEGTQFESRAGGIGGGDSLSKVFRLCPSAPSSPWNLLCPKVQVNGCRQKEA